MVILGIDPGYATTGFGVVFSDRGNLKLLNYGTITTPTTLTFPQRLEVLYDDMEELLKTGVILLAIQKSGVPLYEYTPNQVKQAVVGYGGAEKHQVMDMTRRLLHMEKVARPDDAADAIAIALCHARSSTSLLHQKGYLG